MATESTVHLIMFDIDGTLIESNDFDAALYAEAIDAVLGVPYSTDWRTYRHVTDRGILAEILEQNGLADDPATHEAVESLFARLLQDYVGGNQGGIQQVRGAAKFLDSLKSDPRNRLAIATGGWEPSARIKLAAAGIDIRGIPLASASEAISRVEIMQIAEARALAGVEARSRTYFGDAVWDQQACEALAYDFVCVGGGVRHHTVIPHFEALAASPGPSEWADAAGGDAT